MYKRLKLISAQENTFADYIPSWTQQQQPKL